MRTFFGVVAALVAVFSGGCGMAYLAMAIGEAVAGQGSVDMVVVPVIFGIVPAALAEQVAWALKKQPEPEDTDPNP